MLRHDTQTKGDRNRTDMEQQTVAKLVLLGASLTMANAPKADEKLPVDSFLSVPNPGEMGSGKSSLVLRYVKGQFFDYQVRHGCRKPGLPRPTAIFEDCKFCRRPNLFTGLDRRGRLSNKNAARPQRQIRNMVNCLHTFACMHTTVPPFGRTESCLPSCMQGHSRSRAIP